MPWFSAPAVLREAASIVTATAARSRHALVCFTLPDYLIELYRETLKCDLSPMNYAPSWTVPVPGRYVPDTNGVVAYAT
jgi:hypothetical protein